MATTLIEAVGTYLQTSGQGTLGTNIFLGVMPTTPDLCVAVYESASTPPVETMGATGIAVDVVQMQIIVRAAKDDYVVGRDKAKDIRTLLAAITGQTLSGVRVLRISPESWIMPMGSDNLDRPKFSVRYRCHVGV
jgi:hypothetical protein